MQRVRHRGTEAILQFASVGLLLAAMAVMNEDVRRTIADVLSGDGAAELMNVAAPLQHYVSMAIDTIGPYANGSMLLLAGVSVVLVGFMFRA